jgi:hypothetical protein
MNLLKNTRCYLAGPVEQVDTDEAISWRQEMASFLSTIGVRAYDPLLKPPWLPSACHADPGVYIPIVEGKQDPIIYEGEEITSRVALEANHQMRVVDLRLVHAVDWIICFLPKKFTSGTFEEVYEGLRVGKPVLFCCPDGIVSTWLLTAVTKKLDYRQYFFSDWALLKKYVLEIDKGQIELDPVRWIFLAWRGEDWGNPLAEPDWR